MAYDKTLPEWAVVGAVVLLKGHGDMDYHKSSIVRVTKTSAFLADNSRFVAASYDRRKDYLEEYGSGGYSSWRSGRTIQPMAGDRAKGMLIRKQRFQEARDFEALLNAVGKAQRSGDLEEIIEAVDNLIYGATVRKAQLEVLLAERIERERARQEEAEEQARRAAEREAEWRRENS